MKFKEIVIDRLLRTSIFEMAFSKANAIRRAEDLQFQIAIHLIKVYMYSQSENVNHWCNELNAWLHKIQNFILKGTKKPLNYECLYEILFKQPLGSVEEVQRHMNKIYHQNSSLKINQPDAGEIHANVERVLHNVCMAISNDKFLDIKEYL